MSQVAPLAVLGDTKVNVSEHKNTFSSCYLLLLLIIDRKHVSFASLKPFGDQEFAPEWQDNKIFVCRVDIFSSAKTEFQGLGSVTRASINIIMRSKSVKFLFQANCSFFQVAQHCIIHLFTWLSRSVGMKRMENYFALKERHWHWKAKSFHETVRLLLIHVDLCSRQKAAENLIHHNWYMNVVN